MSAEPISQRAYAKHRGCSVESVSKAITSGRLRESLVLVDGVAKIEDVGIADLEWSTNTRQNAPGVRVEAPSGVPDLNRSRALKEAASARREAAKADLAEIEVAERRGELVPVDQARADVMARFALVRTKLLGVPSRIAQRQPATAREAMQLAEDFIRESLEELAADAPLSDGEADGGDGDE